MLSNLHPVHQFDPSNCRKPTGEGADAPSRRSASCRTRTKGSATASRTKPNETHGLDSSRRKHVEISECCNAGEPRGRASPAERAKRLRYKDMKEAA